MRAKVARILIVTPVPRRSRQGNRVTANRWAGILRSLGYRVVIAQEYSNQACDLLIALHARKSAESVQRFADRWPGRPIILTLTGTDLYADIRRSARAKRSLELATRLVLLQPHGRQELPERLQGKIRVIYQSDPGPRVQPQPLENVFEVCVSGHLRPVKDPFRAALAARRLPVDSRIQITHIGAALSPAMERRARAEMDCNERYRWLGEVPRARARRLLARSRLLVVSSKLEGGANVISEALAARVPVISSRISGSIGMLGADYPGYFEVGDTAELARLMHRCEMDTAFYRALQAWCRRKAKWFEPEREAMAWRHLIREFA